MANDRRASYEAALLKALKEQGHPNPGEMLPMAWPSRSLRWKPVAICLAIIGGLGLLTAIVGGSELNGGTDAPGLWQVVVETALVVTLLGLGGGFLLAHHVHEAETELSQAWAKLKAGDPTKQQPQGAVVDEGTI